MSWLVIGSIVAALYTLWLFFLALQNLNRAYVNKTISKPALILGFPLLVMGGIIDVAVNMTIATVIFLELPREFLVTQRLTRWTTTGSGYRAHLAAWICMNLLDTFDPSGDHCK